MITRSEIHGAPRARRINTLEVQRAAEVEKAHRMRRDRYITQLIERGRYADEERRRHLRLLIMALGYGASLHKASEAVHNSLKSGRSMPDLGPFKVNLTFDR